MSCSSCKSKEGVNQVKWGVMVLGFYIVGAAIYGTVEIVKNLIELIK